MLGILLARQLNSHCKETEWKFPIFVQEGKRTVEKLYSYHAKLELVADVGRSLSAMGKRSLSSLVFIKRSEKQEIGGPTTVETKEIFGDVEIKVAASQGPTDPVEQRGWVEWLVENYRSRGFETRMYFKSVNGGLVVGDVHGAVAGAIDLVLCPKETILLPEAPRKWYPEVQAPIAAQLRANSRKRRAMATRQLGLSDVRQGGRPPRLRLLAPLRYLAIRNQEKAFYDFKLPLIVAVAAFVAYLLVFPKLRIFGDVGLLRFVRDALTMAVPFMVGSLAAVAMGAPGPYLDRRPVGVELFLDGRLLTLRQFVSYLLGYLSLVALTTLGLAIAAPLVHDTVVGWCAVAPDLRFAVRICGIAILSLLLSVLNITVLWSLYFLTDVVSRPAAERDAPTA